MPKVIVHVVKEFDWSCPDCDTHHDLGENEPDTYDTLQCEGCGKEFEIEEIG